MVYSKIFWVLIKKKFPYPTDWSDVHKHSMHTISLEVKVGTHAKLTVIHWRIAISQYLNKQSQKTYLGLCIDVVNFKWSLMVSMESIWRVC